MTTRLTTVFMGTPDFSVPSLRALFERTALTLVVTQPDRPAGRGRALAMSPVKEVALELGVPVLQPLVVKGRRFADTVAAVNPDVIVTAAFGRLLGLSLLAVPRIACVNVHASILPALRGAAPINRAIMNGDSHAGVSIMQMVEELDAGDVYEISTTPIAPDETAGELTIRLAQLGASALLRVLEDISMRVPTPQDSHLVTFAPVLAKADGKVNWNRTALEIHNHIRGVTPWPSAITEWQNDTMKICRASVLAHERVSSGKAPGTIVGASSDGIDVLCGEGVIRLTEIQFPGKKAQHVSQFIHSIRFKEGSQLR